MPKLPHAFAYEMSDETLLCSKYILSFVKEVIKSNPFVPRTFSLLVLSILRLIGTETEPIEKNNETTQFGNARMKTGKPKFGSGDDSGDCLVYPTACNTTVLLS